LIKITFHLAEQTGDSFALMSAHKTKSKRTIKTNCNVHTNGDKFVFYTQFE